MATTKMLVDKSLLRAKILAKQEEDIKQYEKDLLKWQSEKKKYEQAIADFGKRLVKVLAKGTLTSINISEDYEWVDSERVPTGTDVRFDLKGVTPSEFGAIPRVGSKPSDPRENRHGNYKEREAMLSHLEMVKKDEVSIPVDWSQNYL